MAQVIVRCRHFDQCGTELPVTSERMFRRVVGGWAHKREAGGTNHVALIEWGEEFVCWLCLEKLQKGIDPSAQRTLV